MKTKFSLFFAGLLLVTVSLAQKPGIPGLLFREDWNEKPPYDLSIPYSLSQADVMNPDLIQTLYGPGRNSLKKRHHGDASEPYYVYSGFCDSNWAVALSPKNYYLDLSGNAIIRCRIMNSGFRQVHLIIQYPNGNWFVSDIAAGPSSAWKVFDFVIKDIKWSLLNIKTITPGPVADDPSSWDKSGGCLKAFYKMRDEKVIRFIGVTSHADADIINKAINMYEFDTLLTTFNPCPRRKPFRELVLPNALKKNMGIINMKVMGGGGGALASGNPPETVLGGEFTRKSWYWDETPYQVPASTLIRYCLGLPVSCIVVGMKSLIQLEENIASAKMKSLTREEQIAIEELMMDAS